MSWKKSFWNFDAEGNFVICMSSIVWFRYSESVKLLKLEYCKKWFLSRNETGSLKYPHLATTVDGVVVSANKSLSQPKLFTKTANYSLIQQILLGSGTRIFLYQRNNFVCTLKISLSVYFKFFLLIFSNILFIITMSQSE